MTELELYKFIDGHGIEWHWEENDGEPDVLIFPSFDHLQELSQLIDLYCTDREVHCVLKTLYVCVWMREICEFYDIELENVFPKDKEP